MSAAASRSRCGRTPRIYTSVGRTISARDSNSASVMFNAGVSLGFK